MERSRIVKWVGGATVVALLAVQATLWAQGALVVAVPQPYTDTGILFAPANAAAVTAPSAPDAWGGPRTGAEATLSDRVANYRIEATLDPVRHTIDARQQLTWRNRSDRDVKSVYVHLYLNAHKNENSTFYTEERNGGEAFRSGLDVGDAKFGYTELRQVRQDGKDVPWQFVQPDGGPATDETVVRFDLPHSVAPGASTTLDIAFFDQLPRLTVRMGYFDTFHFLAQWFPKIAVLELPGERGAKEVRWNAHEYHAESEYYADFGHYDVKLTVPKGYTVGATGQLQGQPAEKNGLVTHHYVQGDVHDFAWTADSRTAPPLRATWKGPQPGAQPVEVQVLFPPEYRSNAAPVLQATLDSLAYFGRTLGPYPYRTVTVVIPPFNGREAGGMEYPTFFTANSVEDPALDTLGRIDLDLVTIHEFGHGYFYGILASNEFEEPMLDEGLNEFWNLRMLRERKQQLHFTTSLWRQLGFAPTFDPFHFERIGSMLDEPADPLGESAYGRLEGIGPVYTRSALMLHDLEAQLGQDVMEKAMREYYRRWQFRHPSIADLREALADASGQRALVESTFARQVYAVQPVDDRIADFTSEEVLPQPGYRAVNGKQVSVTQAQAEEQADAQRERWEQAHPDAAEGTGPFPYRTAVLLRRKGAAVSQTLVVTFADGSRETMQWQGSERWKRFEWVKPVQAVSAQLDPRRQHLLDANKLDDGRTLKADDSASQRWTFDFGTIVQTLLALLATL